MNRLRVLPVLATSPALAAVAILGAACAQPVVSVEVMPPRTSLTCDAPSTTDPAFGTGLMDAKATKAVHGGYIEDLRFSLPGANARVNGFDLKITRDGTEISSQNDVPTGEVGLFGTKDDIRQAIVENAVLITRDIAVNLAADSKITSVDFATLVLQITPRVEDPGIASVPSTFALNVCNGCLVDPPSSTTCSQVVKNQVCRVGQDVPLFNCAVVAGTGGTGGTGGTP